MRAPAEFLQSLVARQLATREKPLVLRCGAGQSLGKITIEVRLWGDKNFKLYVYDDTTGRFSHSWMHTRQSTSSHDVVYNCIIQTRTVRLSRDEVCTT